jgi:hypothetical protein
LEQYYVARQITTDRNKTTVIYWDPAGTTRRGRAPTPVLISLFCLDIVVLVVEWLSTSFIATAEGQGFESLKKHLFFFAIS